MTEHCKLHVSREQTMLRKLHKIPSITTTLADETVQPSIRTVFPSYCSPSYSLFANWSMFHKEVFFLHDSELWLNTKQFTVTVQLLSLRWQFCYLCWNFMKLSSLLLQSKFHNAVACNEELQHSQPAASPKFTFICPKENFSWIFSIFCKAELST